MNTISDKEIKALFEAAKQQPIADNGFTRKVMTRLPQKRQRDYSAVVWTFGIVGVLIAYFSGAFFNILASLAYFGFQLSQAHIPSHSTVLVYLLVLGAILSMSASFIKKSWV